MPSITQKTHRSIKGSKCHEFSYLTNFRSIEEPIIDGGICISNKEPDGFRSLKTHIDFGYCSWTQNKISSEIEAVNHDLSENKILLAETIWKEEKNTHAEQAQWRLKTVGNKCNPRL